MKQILENRILFWTLIGLALLAYVLPWVVNPGAGLTVGGYDLAEWISLSPVARTQSPALLTVFLLRLPLLCLTLLIAFDAPMPVLSYGWWGYALLIVLLVVAQCPPLEFVSQTDDINYRQQAFLAGLSLLGGLIGLSGKLRRFRPYLAAVMLIVTAIAAVAGWLQARDIMQAYHLPADIGFGVIGLAVLCVLVVIAAGYVQVTANRAAD